MIFILHDMIHTRLTKDHWELRPLMPKPSHLGFSVKLGIPNFLTVLSGESMNILYVTALVQGTIYKKHGLYIFYHQM